jgi:hypothetical protein
MTASITLYTPPSNKCGRTHRNYHRCGCPVWTYNSSAPRGQQRKSADTNDWDEAMQKAANAGTRSPLEKISVKEAIDLYLIKRSKKLQNLDKAPCKDRYKNRWLLRDGSKRQKSVLLWATGKKFSRLDQVTAAALDTWRNTWVFSDEGHSLKTHNAVLKAFFKWATRFKYLDRDPFDKLDKIEVTEGEPTLPLTMEEYESR